MRRAGRAAVVAAGTVVFVFVGGSGALPAVGPRPSPDDGGATTSDAARPDG